MAEAEAAMVAKGGVEALRHWRHSNETESIRARKSHTEQHTPTLPGSTRHLDHNTVGRARRAGHSSSSIPRRCC